MIIEFYLYLSEKRIVKRKYDKIMSSSLLVNYKYISINYVNYVERIY